MTPSPAVLDSLANLLVVEASRRAQGGLAALAGGTPQGDVPLPPELIALLGSNRDALHRWLADVVAPAHPRGGFAADPAGWLADRVADGLLGWNQFLPIDGPRRAELAAIHARALAAAADALAATPSAATLAEALGAILAAYRRDLSAFTSALTSPGGTALREVVAGEYPPDLQLRVLGLDVVTLPEPILDLGCGREGRLVAALRARGKDARGVDRLAEPGPDLSRGDWLDVPLAPGGYGTVISHLGFSLHFLHHHMRPGDEALRYARRYMAVLHALRPGGLFAYAPGLPFIEAHLDAATWRVERSPVPLPPSRAPFPAMGPDAGPDGAPWYACRVWRRPAPARTS